VKGEADTKAGESDSLSRPKELEESAESGIVSTDWLAKKLEQAGVTGADNDDDHQRVRDAGLVLFDATHHLTDKTRDAKQEWQEQHIAGSGYFDISRIANTDSPWPNTVPGASAFERHVGALGVNNSDLIIAYDGLGLFSAARVWWMFRYFGHQRVAVLDGGLPKWISEGRQLLAGNAKLVAGNFSATEHSQLYCSAESVADASASSSGDKDSGITIVDARGAGRFAGHSPEPRPGLRSGHIPGSVNLPFQQLLNDDFTYKSPEQLRSLFESIGLKDDSAVITSCGSGVTACIISLGLSLAGFSDAKLFDGSWTEWGSRDEFDIATLPS